MKKITLFSVLALTANALFAQNLTTGVINIPDPLLVGRTVKFDVNTTTNVVTMTMVLPQDKWFGVAFSNKAGGIQGGQTMASKDDDVIVGLNTGVEDRNMSGVTTTPPLDLKKDWTLVSNTSNGGMQTIVATRNRDTGDIEDFVFPNVAGPLPLLYAAGSTVVFDYHDEGNGFFQASLSADTLGTNDFDFETINIHPNPVSSVLKINAPYQVLENLYVEVYNILGEKVFNKTFSKQDCQVSVSDWSNGIYVMKISSSKDNKSVVKRFVKI